MINEILKKALSGKSLENNEILALFQIDNYVDFIKMLKTAVKIRNKNNRPIKLTSTVHMTNKCQVSPKCKYCGFAAGTSKEGYFHSFFKQDQEILDAVLNIEKSGIPRVSCSGAHGFKGKHAVKAAQIVKENTSLELLVNVGSDLTKSAIEQLAYYETDTICCNLETVNEEIFNDLKPGETLDQRIEICQMVSDEGVELSSGLLIGLGESYQDRINHLNFLKRFETLGEIPIMGFNPYKGTPMENHPKCSLEEQLKTIAITRILFPPIRITVPTPTIGPKNVQFSLMAGADNLATVIPDSYPHEVKGVGSPVFGNLKDVLEVLDEMGLKAQLNEPQNSNHYKNKVPQIY
ncbi:5,10-methenyltetrahydromethanopterin hydrogenase cofactor biosynthesis protein HmdB [Methanobacterium alcaliphilum]|uniref:5,10-methenyltetrahydromethanopterin hydrogenase cofactor biosynthesis protein HmdB n=1 Tax=Methanobacterium alcaliphilum TaxID=392018 RepID=UPI00200AC17B|nr:5,10-methenyltetrahydromethanopterin hydrogenase cofactor biosynthesis protein HmdB [Methanobacterium alcaliphilum]MCK9152532.1 5,10-methenyltetrahydromethanopterin hydrogenase cofactor biosynthesis protein HmdB [Methanobacterium alcaliphilum]